MVSSTVSLIWVRVALRQCGMNVNELCARTQSHKILVLPFVSVKVIAHEM